MKKNKGLLKSLIILLIVIVVIISSLGFLKIYKQSKETNIFDSMYYNYRKLISNPLVKKTEYHDREEHEDILLYPKCKEIINQDEIIDYIRILKVDGKIDGNIHRTIAIELYTNDDEKERYIHYNLDSKKIKFIGNDNLDEFINIINELIIKPFKVV